MKKDINHTPTRTLKKHRLRSALSVKPGLKPTTSLKKSKMIFLTEPVKKCRSLSLQNLPSWHLW